MTKSTKFDTFAPVAFLILAIAYTFPFFMKLSWWGVRDWDLFTAIAAAPVRSVLDYGQFPFWNPWIAGGNILFHHPEVGVITPFFLINLVAGVVVGLKFQVLICYWLGFWGSYRMARALGQSPMASALVAIAYFGSVHFAMHFAEGHMPFTHFAFLPWFVEGILKSREPKPAIVLSIVALALMVLGNGAAVPFLYTMTFCGMLFLLTDLKNGSAKLTGRFVIASALGIGVSAIKFVPMTLYLMENSWTGNATESIPLTALGSVFLGWDHSLFSQNFSGQLWAWHEYGSFLFPLTLLLAAWGFARKFSAHWPWFFAMTFFFLFGLGDFGPLSPWQLLSHLPGFDALRCSGRSFQFVTLSVAVVAGYGLDDFVGKLRASRARVVGVISVALVLGANLWFGIPIMNSAFTTPPEKIVAGEMFEHVTVRGKRAYELILANKGALITPQLSAYHPSRALVGPDDKVIPEYVITGNGEVVSRNFSPNQLVYKVKGDASIQGGMMAVSMGYDRGWTSTSGIVQEFNGVLSFPFEPSEQTITLTYSPPGLLAGTIVSLLALVAVVVLWRRWR